MPVIQMYGPKMTKEQKKELIRSFANETSRILGIDVSAVNTTIFETDPDNVGVGNITLREHLEKCK